MTEVPNPQRNTRERRAGERNADLRAWRDLADEINRMTWAFDSRDDRRAQVVLLSANVMELVKAYEARMDTESELRAEVARLEALCGEQPFGEGRSATVAALRFADAVEGLKPATNPPPMPSVKPAASDAPMWIPTARKFAEFPEFPEPGQQVLVYGTRHADCVGTYPPEVGVDTYRGFGAWANFDDVTHWCPFERVEKP